MSTLLVADGMIFVGGDMRLVSVWDIEVFPIVRLRDIFEYSLGRVVALATHGGRVFAASDNGKVFMWYKSVFSRNKKLPPA